MVDDAFCVYSNVTEVIDGQGWPLPEVLKTQ